MYLTEPYTEILGGKDVFIDQHSALNLTCVIHAPEPPAHIFWIHDDHVSIEIRIYLYFFREKNQPHSIFNCTFIA